MNGEKDPSAAQKGNSPVPLPHKLPVAARKPRAVEPASPRKILAGGKLWTKNPALAAAIVNWTAAKPDQRAPARASVMKPITAMPPANPSMPSMKL